jgi:hypothetical protein
MATERKITLIFSFALRCDDHRYYGSLPCPWPNCSNGVEESILIATGPATIEPETYRRVEWPPFDGETYYSWEEDSVPAWFSADRLISQEAERRLPRSDSQETVYHYTSVGAFVGIVDDCSLWLTDFDYLSDATEVKHGITLARRAIAGAIDATQGSKPPKFLDDWMSDLQSPPPVRICMACFSLDGDNLSQWRSYEGVSVGFGRPFNFGYGPGTLLDRVLYDNGAQEAILRLFIHHHLAAFSYDERNDQKKILEAYRSLDRLYQRLVFFKNSAFADEREARLVYMEDPKLFKMAAFPIAPKRFRTKDNLLIPYVRSADIARTPIKQLPITEVIVGPQRNADVVQSGLQELLSARGSQV